MHSNFIELHNPDVMLSLEKAPAGGTAALYRFYNKAGELLYVGVTGNVLKRCSQHRLQSAWWFETWYMTLGWYRNRMEAFRAEADAIRTELPWHNDQFNPREDRTLYQQNKQ